MVTTTLEAPDSKVVDVLIGIGYMQNELDRITDIARARYTDATVFVTLYGKNFKKRWQACSFGAGVGCTLRGEGADPLEALHSLEIQITRRIQSDAALARTLGL